MEGPPLFLFFSVSTEVLQLDVLSVKNNLSSYIYFAFMVLLSLKKQNKKTVFATSVVRPALRKSISKPNVLFQAQ